MRQNDQNTDPTEYERGKRRRRRPTMENALMPYPGAGWHLDQRSRRAALGECSARAREEPEPKKRRRPASMPPDLSFSPFRNNHYPTRRKAPTRKQVVRKLINLVK